MMFTPHQERALETSRHIAVTANAGSGKTRVLVERYLRIVGNGVPLEEVVALTYTEKAAGELKRRIADRVMSEIARAPDPGALIRWEAVRDGLATAFVGTIHAFCARILREFPVEAGVDAAFTVMEGVDAGDALQAAIAGTMREILRDGLPAVPREDLLSLLRGMGRTRGLGVLTALVAKRELFDRLEGGLYRRTDDEILSSWRTVLRDAGEREMGAQGLASDVESLLGSARGRERGAAEEKFREVKEPGDAGLRAAAFVSLMDIMFTARRELRVSVFGKGETDAGVRACVRRVMDRRGIIDALAALSTEVGPAESHRALLYATRTLLAIARDVALRYEAEKAEGARLDFDDLQLKMRGLLRHEAVCAQLARRFRFVMVDEYQDTNTLQIEILLPLLNHLASGNLFIVGDPKQSIYRFRDADVRVFEKTTSAIVSAAGADAVVALGESFRPLRDIAAFVNLVFSRLMLSKEGAGGEGVPYDPLVVARANDSPGRVELLLAPPPQQGGEPELVARRILALRREGEMIFGDDEQPRPMTFRDVALLLRNRLQLELYEEAFIRSGIPYLVSGGVGFFQTQDINDVYNYLRFLLATSDDVALAGILRSPFFTVSDAELLRLAHKRSGGSLWEALSSGAGAAFPSLARAVQILTDDRAVAVRLPVPELLSRLINRSHLAGALAGTVRGDQAMANLEKLSAMARAYEAQGFTGLYDFVARLGRLMDEEEKEGQAAIETQADAVQIMTVHAAKGLEFPVVIIPRLHAPPGRDREPYIDDHIGIGFRPGPSDAPTAPITAYLRECERRKQREEEDRVFYVACTRARDLLILSAEEGESGKEKNSWLDRLLEAFPGAERAGDLLTAEVTTARYLPSDGHDQVRPDSHTLAVPIVRTLDPEAPPPITVLAVPGGARMAIEPVESRPSGEIYSASKIRTYIECPSKYYFRYVLGYPLGGGPFVRGEEEDLADRDYPAEIRGRVFHAVMEQADVLAKTGIDEALRSVILRDVFPHSQGSDRLAADVATLVRNVLSSNAWTEIARGSEVRTELSISAALEGDFITGTIDRLYRDAQGVWTVLDYKTDSVGAAELHARAETYWPQLSFYAVMVRRLYGAPTVRLRLLFTAHPETQVEKYMTEVGLRQAEREIASVIARIKAGDFSPPPGPCQQCPLRPGRCG